MNKNMNTKIILTIIATIIGIVSFLPYLKDMLSLKTKPHAYTWLIWSITQGTAVFGIYYGGGGWGGLLPLIGTFFAFFVFLLSLKYGTKNIKKGDTIILITALIAVLFWWQLHQPLLSIFIVSVIDFFGYIPSFRKSWEEPWSETLVAWVGFSLANILAILALSQYNFLTMFYLIVITSANFCLFFLCLFRRNFVIKPN